MTANPIHIPRFPHAIGQPKGELSSMIDMLPSSFDLVSPGSLARQGVELVSNAANSRRFLSVLTSLQSHLRAASVPVLVTTRKQGPGPIPADDLSRSQRRWIGQLALELYFTQLFRSEVAVVDLWPSSFGVDEAGDAVWSPRPFYLRWDPRFRDGLRDIYAGFFLNDRERFDLGVYELGLENASTTLIAHFGTGSQRSVRFGPHELRSALGAMSKQRKSFNDRLHPNFVGFGLYLMALHEMLGTLDMAFDVRAAFMRSYPGSSHR